MVARHCVTWVGCTAYSLASCETVLSPTRASNPTLALKAALCRLRFPFISLLFLIYSRLTKVYLNHWSSFWGPPLFLGVHLIEKCEIKTEAGDKAGRGVNVNATEIFG